MKPTDLMAKQHRDVLAVFDELEFTDDALERTRLIAFAAVRLKAHAALKEEVFYPALRASAAAPVEEALAAQRAIDLVLDEAVGTPSAANVQVLRDLVEQRFQNEEASLFPVAQALDDDASQALAEALQAHLRAADEALATEGLVDEQ